MLHPDEPFDDLRSQQRQVHHAAHLHHVDAFGLGDLGRGRHPLLIQRPLPVVREAERMHQSRVLSRFTNQSLAACLLQESLRCVQRRDDQLLEPLAHQCQGRKVWTCPVSTGSLEVLDLMGIFHQMGDGGFAVLEAVAHSAAGLSTGWVCGQVGGTFSFAKDDLSSGAAPGG